MYDNRLINNTPRVVALPPLRHASFRLSATTRGVLFLSLAAFCLHELLALGQVITGPESRFQFWPFSFERVRRSHSPADEWERRHSEELSFEYFKCCCGGPATSFEPPVKIKSCQNEKNLKILKTIFNGNEVLKFEHIVFSTNFF